MTYFVDSIIYKSYNNGDTNGVFLDDNTYFFSYDDNLTEGDLVNRWDAYPLPDLNSNVVSWDHAVASTHIDGGRSFYFYVDDSYYRHYVQTNYDDGPQKFDLFGSLKQILDIHSEEESKYIDIDGDGYQGAPPPVIKKVLSQGPNSLSLFLSTEDEMFTLNTDIEYSEGDKVRSNDYIQYYTGIEFEGFSPEDYIYGNYDKIYFYNSSTKSLYLQPVKDQNGNFEADASVQDVTDRLEQIEKNEGFDFDSNGRVGPRIPLVDNVIFYVTNWYTAALVKDDEGNYWLSDYSEDEPETGDEVHGNNFRKILVEGLDSSVNLDNSLAYHNDNNKPTLLISSKVSNALLAQELQFNENHDNYDLSNYALGSVKSYDLDSKKVYNWERDFIIDLNDDGFVGTPVPSVETILFEGSNKTLISDDFGSYRLIDSDREYETGDEITDWSQVILTDGLDESIKLKNALAHSWGSNDGFSLWFSSEDSNSLVNQKFKKTSSDYENSQAAIASGSPKFYQPYSTKVIQVEHENNIDLNNDGFIGEKDVEIKEVLLSDRDSNQYFYLTQDNDIIMAQEELDEGDIVSDWFRKIIDKSGDTFDFKDGIKAFNWINNGFGVIYEDKSEYKLQSFTESNDVASPRGNARKVTNKIQKYEENWGYDIDGDSEIGTPPETVQKVIFKGEGNDDQWIYQSSNGSLILAEEDLAKDDILDDNNKFFDSKGNDFEVDGEIRAYSWQGRGPGLIYKEEQKYKLQLFRDRNGNFTANGKPRDITKRIEKYEDELNIDINKDGTFGEQIVDVSEVLFSGVEGYEEKGIYRASNNDLVASEPELEKGDVFNYETTIVDSDGDPFEPGDRVAGVRGAKGGFSLIYQDGTKFYEQLFRESRDIARQNGKKRDVTKKIFKLEDELGIDLNKDGSYGDEAPVIQNVLFDGTQGFDYRGIYRLQNGSLIVSDSEMEKGDTPSYYSSIVDGNGDPFDPADRVAAIRDSNRGFSLIYQDGNKYLEQIFKEVGDFARTNGKPRNVTKKIKKLEDDLGVDIDQDDRFGKEPPSIKNVYFDGVDGGTDTGVYSLNTGELIAADSELEAEDTPRDYLIFVDKNGDLYDVPSSSGPSGLISAKGGFGLVYSDEGKFYLQQFRESKDYLRINGKARNITKQIFKMEDKEGIDFNRDFVYGKGSPVVDRIIYGGSDNIDYGVYRMDDNELIVAESDLDKGDVPFAVIGTLRSSKKTNEQYDIEAKVVGAAARDGKYYLFLNDDAKIIAQSYESAGNGQYLMEKGSTNITSKLEKYEQDFFMDFDGNGVIGPSD